MMCGGKQPDGDEDSDVMILAFRRCARCKQKVYCSETCQRVHWRKAHRFECTESQSVSTMPFSMQLPPRVSHASTSGRQKTAQEERRENRKLMKDQVIRVQYDAGAIGLEASNALDPGVTSFAS